MKNSLLRYGPVIIWMCLMFFMSSRSDLSTGATQEVDFASKKLAHILEYFILNAFWFRALGDKNSSGSILYSLAFAFTDEIHQLFIPGRTGMLRDVGIDFIGIITSALLILKFSPWKNFLYLAPSKRLKR